VDDRFDAVFVGGGVIGLSAARAAAQAGLRVAVVDPAPGHGATWVAAGMLAPVTEAQHGEGTISRLLVAGARRWAGFAADLEAETGTSVGYRRTGTVMVALDASDRAVLHRLLDLQRALGLEAEALTAAELRDRIPTLAPGVRGGIEVPGDHQVDNRRLVGALAAACGALGVVMVAERAREVRWCAGAADGVTLEGGAAVGADTVVLTAGAATGTLGGVPPALLPPVRPVKGHVVRLRDPSGAAFLPCTVRAVVRGRPCYLVPRGDGRVVLGATMEERDDDRVLAGAVHGLLDDARAVVPGVDELVVEECAAGLRPGSPDNGPFVGPTPARGLVLATGHHRHGILLAPLTADAVLAALTGGEPPPALSPFGACRHAVA
jgi:glycine oxidase